MLNGLKLYNMAVLLVTACIFPLVMQECFLTVLMCPILGTHLATALRKCTNRGKIELLDTYLLAALDQLKGIEMHIESLKQRYSSGISSLLGPASSLDANVPTVTEYGSDIGRHKGAANAGEESLRILRDIELHISAIDATKSKIRIAHGALYR